MKSLTGATRIVEIAMMIATTIVEITSNDGWFLSFESSGYAEGVSFERIPIESVYIATSSLSS